MSQGYNPYRNLMVNLTLVQAKENYNIQTAVTEMMSYP